VAAGAGTGSKPCADFTNPAPMGKGPTDQVAGAIQRTPSTRLMRRRSVFF